ncbi:hypothetical protein G8V03_09735 [Clostridium botulinum D/C]|nr:hypothetical protein [Clostridium botulinum]MCD3351266.1 hypothetical protein [Clostridium botulinum D/C]MCD3360223.1 hypothetical protein [Clostridium botulinum D/C]MCD3361674.1 hypothetical protein [Clostridium botulinum D/C]MCD3366028.1 hypothetical protein [Clostridium botulinum D/C]
MKKEKASLDYKKNINKNGVWIVQTKAPCPGLPPKQPRRVMKIEFL